MAYDSAATRTRLLEAAYAEFVERGLAGGRVERIATAAAANKQAIYAYSGSKHALFDAVLDARLRVLADLVPFTPEDLPAYAGALFDQLVADPGLMRLTQWKALERPEASQSELEAHLTKANSLAASHGSSPEDGMDTLMLVLAIAQAWSLTAPAIRNPDGDDTTARLNRHRNAVIRSATAIASELMNGPGLSRRD
jgi:AcrR family transcriptional regulator